MQFLVKLLSFGYQQALCCIFPVAIFATLAFTQYIDVPFFYRYDFILLICICVQFLMVYFKLETIDELKVISLFHLIGLFLELYKVSKGSWVYPQFAYTKIGDVPIYSGFMYASVASYICQAWRRFDLRFHDWPSSWITFPLAAAIYFNFFTLHYLPDMRWIIIVSLFFIFRRSYVSFVCRGATYKMNIILSFLLIGSFIWVAENISTFLGAWQYPNQERHWNVVHIGKLSSWFLLVIISIIIVANLKHIKYNKKQSTMVEPHPTDPEPLTAPMS